MCVNLLFVFNFSQTILLSRDKRSAIFIIGEIRPRLFCFCTKRCFVQKQKRREKKIENGDTHVYLRICAGLSKATSLNNGNGREFSKKSLAAYRGKRVGICPNPNKDR